MDKQFNEEFLSEYYDNFYVEAPDVHMSTYEPKRPAPMNDDKKEMHLLSHTSISPVSHQTAPGIPINKVNNVIYENYEDNAMSFPSANGGKKNEYFTNNSANNFAAGFKGFSSVEKVKSFNLKTKSPKYIHKIYDRSHLYSPSQQSTSSSFTSAAAVISVKDEYNITYNGFEKDAEFCLTETDDGEKKDFTDYGRKRPGVRRNILVQYDICRIFGFWK